MKIFVINLDTAKDRWEHYKDDERFTRWSATSREEVKEWDSKKMISFHNIHPDQHLAKCACLKSHLNILSYIITNKMNDVLILEDDALVGDLSELDKREDNASHNLITCILLSYSFFITILFIHYILTTT